MNRQTYIQRCLRQIYGGIPSDDSNITVNLVNLYLNDAIAVAAKQAYTGSVALDGIAYLNNSFYTTYKGIAVVVDENYTYKITLPHVPFGLGQNEGVASLRFKSQSNVSYDGIPLTTNQVGYVRGRRQIPNKILYWSEGMFLYALSSQFDLSTCTAIVRMASGGNSLDLTSTINVPDEYFQLITEYLKAQLAFELAQPKDTQNDGAENR